MLKPLNRKIADDLQDREAEQRIAAYFQMTRLAHAIKGQTSGTPTPTPTPIHSLDLTTAPSASNAFDDYGLALPRTVTDYNGRIVTIPADAVPMGGLRPVYNYLAQATNVGTSAVYNYQVNVSLTDIGNGETQITATANTAYAQIRLTIPENSATFMNSVDIKYASALSGVCILNAPNGLNTNITSSIGSDYKRFASSSAPGFSSTQVRFGFFLSAIGDSIIVKNEQIQDITHRADLSTAPDEYVSTADDYGTGVNGFRYFDTELANTVASNVVTEVTGDSIAGWLDYQPEATNQSLDSNQFTLWVTQAGATISASTAVVAPDGTSNTYLLGVDGSSVSSGIRRVGEIPSSGTWTISIYARAKPGEAGVKFRLQTYSVTDGAKDSDNFTLSESWERYDFTVTVTLATQVNVQNSSPAATSEFYIFGIQVEAGTVPTAYIPTSGTALTRPAMSPAPTISGLAGTEDARVVVTGVAADLVTPDPTDTTERIIDIDNTDGEFDTLPSPCRVLSIDVYNDGERPA